RRRRRARPRPAIVFASSFHLLGTQVPVVRRGFPVERCQDAKRSGPLPAATDQLPPFCVALLAFSRCSMAFLKSGSSPAFTLALRTAACIRPPSLIRSPRYFSISFLPSSLLGSPIFFAFSPRASKRSAMASILEAASL